MKIEHLEPRSYRGPVALKSTAPMGAGLLYAERTPYVSRKSGMRCPRENENDSTTSACTLGLLYAARQASEALSTRRSNSATADKKKRAIRKLRIRRRHAVARNLDADILDPAESKFLMADGAFGE